MRTLDFTVTAAYNGKKLVCFLRGECGLSASLTATLRHTREGILLNGIPSRTIDRVCEGDTVTVHIPDNTVPPLTCEMELEVLYEDEDVIIINKPAGISMHPNHNHPNGTLANALAAYLQKTGQPPCCARAVGRLDKGTSGIVVFAKNRFAAAALSQNIKKEYIAIACAQLEDTGTVDAGIIRPFKEKTLRAVSPQGERAVTHWRVVQRLNGASLIALTLETGRTHQIRVHMAYMGAVLLGDDMYGAAPTPLMSRPALHCKSLELVHPVTGERMFFDVPMPRDMTEAVKSLS